MSDIILCFGDKVKKRSNKPFKSGNKINTIESITINPKTDKIAYTFEEDDSVVDCWKCKKVDRQDE